MPVIKLSTPDLSGVYYEFDPSERLLGEGGMGRVYRGWRVSASGGRRAVAIKCLKEDVPESVVERARREADVRVRNDNLVEMIDFIETNDTDVLGLPIKHFHVVSELLMGVTLDNVLMGNINDQDGEPVPEAQNLLNLRHNNPYLFAIKVVSALLKGLIALHSAGYIHRDLDPTNIMVCRDGQIRIIDYGIAKQVKKTGSIGHATTSMGQFLGKPTYAPPELIMGDIVHQDFTTDLYSIGGMLFHFITGDVPFHGAHHEVTAKHLSGKFPMERVKQRAAADVINKACAKKQDERYQSAVEFLADVERLRQLPYPDNKASMAKYYVVVGSLSVAVIGLLLVMLLRKPDAPAIPVDNSPIAQAKALMADNATFQKGFAQLADLAAKGDADAMALQSMLLITTATGAGDTPDVQAVRNVARQQSLAPDSVKAHNLRLELAAKTQQSQHQADVAEDFIKGIGTAPDRAKAEEYILMAEKSAAGADDQARVKRLRGLAEYTFRAH